MWSWNFDLIRQLLCRYFMLHLFDLSLIMMSIPSFVLEVGFIL